MRQFYSLRFSQTNYGVRANRRKKGRGGTDEISMQHSDRTKKTNTCVLFGNSEIDNEHEMHRAHTECLPRGRKDRRERNERGIFDDVETFEFYSSLSVALVFILKIIVILIGFRR